MKPTMVALIPARQGSVRVKDKNVRMLNSHPLMAYTIASALESGVFGNEIYVSTDSDLYAEIARNYGAKVILRPAEYATSTSPDIEWVTFSLGKLREMGHEYDAFSILRVTSPFRQATQIREAWQRWLEKGTGYDSLRGVQKVPTHPYKVFRYEQPSSNLCPLMAEAPDWYEHGAPGHSRQYQSLPTLYAQTGGMEIAWCKTVFEKGSIAGDRILPFFMEGPEALDINRPEDWLLCETLIAQGKATLPTIPKEKP